MLRSLKRRRPRPSSGDSQPKKRRSFWAAVSREAFALTVVVFGLLSAASLIHPAVVDDYEVTGVVTRSLYGFYRQWFGVLQLIPPLLICVLGVRMLFGPATLRLYRCALGIYLISFSISSILHMALGPGAGVDGLYPAGLFGKFNHDLLVPGLFDSWGGAIVFCCIGLLGASILIGAPVSKMAASSWRVLGSRLRSLAVYAASAGRSLVRAVGGFLRWMADIPNRVGLLLRSLWTRVRSRFTPRTHPDEMARHKRVSTQVAATTETVDSRSQTQHRSDTAKSERHEGTILDKPSDADDSEQDKSETIVRQSAKQRPSQKALFSPEELSPLPPVSLLDPGSEDELGRIVDQSDLLVKTLRSFDVEAKVINRMVGPVVTRYELSPAPGERVSKIVRLADDIALSLAASAIRIEAPIPGKAAIGIEVPNKEPTLVRLRQIIETPEFQNSRSKLAVALGMDIAGRSIVGDLIRMVHLLVAGATGSGKSVCLNTLIVSILMKATPEEVKLLLIDPKRVELSMYDGIPHLMAPVITDPKKAAGYLLWVVEQMENRYKLFHAAGVRNIERYNALCAASSGEDAPKPLPYYVVVIDELADMMMVAQAEVEASISRLAFMARAAGIHLVMATQRPSADVVTGIIKANIPSRIAFSVSSGIDSRIILDAVGAEKLLGRGDMLYLPNGAAKPVRVQGAYISDEEIQRLTDYLRNLGNPQYEAESRELKEVRSNGAAGSDEEEDEYFREAVKLVIETGQASVSMLQRRFPIGYSRAGRLIDAMEEKGIVGPHEGSKPRRVLYERGEWRRWLPSEADAESIQHRLSASGRIGQGDDEADWSELENEE
ncbi:MAG: DNA translocase FtsK [Bacillota bacterium]|jgi:hypothetical protein